MTRKKQSRGRGFTLIESALTTVIVGTGGAGDRGGSTGVSAQKNNWAQRTGDRGVAGERPAGADPYAPDERPVHAAEQYGPERPTRGAW